MADFSPADVDQVRRLFNPRSVALIGATDKSRWSWSIFGNLQLHGFAGPVYLVNPRGVPVHGRDSYRSVADLPEPVDLAFVMVPTTAVLGVLIGTSLQQHLHARVIALLFAAILVASAVELVIN